ncbi:MAG TPA: hypothetical protein HPP87_10110 [Planctomycetes bacterium]|nr:hypothetical protein [Planctomycetota bacterium]
MLTEADNIVKFLDADWHVVLWKNALGTYSAALIRREEYNSPGGPNTPVFECNESRITDGNTPTEALKSLEKKFLTRGDRCTNQDDF